MSGDRRQGCRAGLILSAVFVGWGWLTYAQRSTCLEFLSPEPGAAISTPACTITVRACPVVTAVSISAIYFRSDGVNRDTVRLARITRPPYKVVWPTTALPNQLVMGATLLAEGELLDGGRLTARREGVFLAHNRPKTQEVDLSRSGRFTGEASSPVQLKLAGPESSREVTVKVSWDRHNLVFAVTVKDDGFRASQPEALLRTSGCEILLDPTAAGRPFPDDSVVAFMVCLTGDVIRRRYVPMFQPDGTYILAIRSESSDVPHSVKVADGKGWKATCAIPESFFTRSGRPWVRANVVVRIAQTQGDAQLYAWSGSTSQEIYAPLYWGTLLIREKPLSEKPGLLFAIGAAAGMLMVFIGYPVARRFRSTSRMILPFETPEGERTIAEMMMAYIESRITDKNLSLDDVAREFAIEPRRVELLLRKYCGLPFHDYVADLRIAVAKERLRSTNASESSIAEQCGFKNVGDMERLFLKRCRVTPYKYRLEQQVS